MYYRFVASPPITRRLPMTTIITRTSATCTWAPSWTRMKERSVSSRYDTVPACQLLLRRQLVFTYKLTRGAAESSFGTHVASLAGVSSDVVKRAEQISTDFAKQFSARLEAKRSISSRIPLVTQADFAFICKVALGTEPTDKIHLSKVLNSLSASTKASLARVVVQS